MAKMLIGNTLEETAYHEAGHIAVAGAAGLDLKLEGIVIYEIAEDVTDGWAFYWEDKPEWEKILLAVRAGQVAQLRQFPQSEIRGGQPDVKRFFSIVADRFGSNRGGELWEDITASVRSLLDTHWAAVVAVAEALVKSDWIPVDEAEHALAKRKKHLDGDALVAILGKHGVPAQVRR